MRVRKFSPLRIPAKIVPNTVRFYREVFDLPTEFGINESRHLFFDQKAIVFNEDPDADPITVQVVVRDHRESVENHFINYEVKESKPATESDDGRHVIFYLDDIDGNHIEVIANK